ncbi:MAG TPA: CapA family protein [Candidatus Eisenbacteria bacterium]|jgi:poly-gamma-glutamate synthesis protein (capsule biosynthesis protein)
MRRREFLERAAGLAAGLLLARRGRSAEHATSAAPDAVARAAPDSASRPAGPAVTLAVAGDTTLGYNLEAHVDDMLAGGALPDQVWPLYGRGVRAVLDAADLALVNLECPFTERGEKLPKNFNFRARRELVKILEAASVDVVSLANNHLMDYGREGIEDTIATLDSAGIGWFGAGTNRRAAHRPLVLEPNGVRVGFLGYYFQAPPDMLEPEAVYALPHGPGVAGCYQDLDCMRRRIREDLPRLARKVDAAIPYFHWGKEGSYEVRDYQIELAHLSVDLGARAVLGAHPHRLQGIEVYRDAPIFYSLGNFMFGGNKDPEDKLSAVVRLALGRSGVAACDVVPIQITTWPDAPFQPFVLEGDARAEALARIARLSERFASTLPQLRGAG